MENLGSGPEFADSGIVETDDEAAALVALGDASRIVDRDGDDEAAAAAARVAYQTEPMTRLEPDPAVAQLLAPGERLLAIRRWATLERRQPIPGERLARGLGGQLFITSRRLLHVGRLVLTFQLADITETALGAGHLLVVMRDGTGLALGVDQPRLLRVQIAEARATARL